MYLACYYSVRAIGGSVELKLFIITDPRARLKIFQSVTAYYIC